MSAKNGRGIKKRKRGRPTLAASINPDQILRAALKCFAEAGFRGAKTLAISKRAKVDDSLIFYHFKNKENLWKKAIELAYHDYIEDAQEVIKLYDDMDLLSWSKANIRHGIIYNARHPELYQIIFHEMTLKSERSDWLIQKILKPYTKKVYMLHKNLKSAGLAKDFPLSNLVALYTGSLNSFFILHHQMRQQFDIDVFSEEQINQYADTVIEVFFNSFLK